MKISNPETVAHFAVSEDSFALLSKAYRELRREHSNESWFDWPTYVMQNRASNRNFPSFVAHVITCVNEVKAIDEYGNPAMDRRTALRVIEQAGLRLPNAMEVFQIATQERIRDIQSRRLPPLLHLSLHSMKIYCPTPICLEFPMFYYFGRDSIGGVVFRTEDYLQKGKRLYFRNPNSLSMRDVGGKYEFERPLLLGVEM